MKNKKNWFGMIVMVLAFFMVGTACVRSTFTLTNIPSRYNGKYAILRADHPNVSFRWLVGGEKIERNWDHVGVRISDGSVTLPIWLMEFDEDFNIESIERLTDRAIATNVIISIFDSAVITESSESTSYRHFRRWLPAFEFGNYNITMDWRHGF